METLSFNLYAKDNESHRNSLLFSVMSISKINICHSKLVLLILANRLAVCLIYQSVFNYLTQIRLFRNLNTMNTGLQDQCSTTEL